MKQVNGDTHQSSSITSQGEINSLKDAANQLRRWNNNLRNHVLIPVGEFIQDGLKNHPLLTSYLIVMVGLSIVPIMTFIGFSFFVSSILVGTGLLYALTWGVVIIGSAFIVLLMTLAPLLAVAAWIVIGSFLTIFSLRIIYGLQNNLVDRVKRTQIGKDVANYSSDDLFQQPSESVKSEH